MENKGLYTYSVTIITRRKQSCLSEYVTEGERKMSRVIHLSSELKPVHSFDLWGTLVNQEILGFRVLQAYRQLMNLHSLDQVVIEKNVCHYESILTQNGDFLSQNKKQIVNIIENPVWSAYRRGEIDISFDNAFYEDALAVLTDIVEAEEGICILTTGESPWVQRALRAQIPFFEHIDVPVYFGDKTKPETYDAAALGLSKRNLRMVSHTEDTMTGFVGLLNSRLNRTVMKTYVDRVGHTPETLLCLGIDYVTDLRDVSYIQQ